MEKCMKNAMNSNYGKCLQKTALKQTTRRAYNIKSPGFRNVMENPNLTEISMWRNIATTSIENPQLEYRESDPCGISCLISANFVMLDYVYRVLYPSFGRTQHPATVTLLYGYGLDYVLYRG